MRAAWLLGLAIVGVAAPIQAQNWCRGQCDGGQAHSQYHAWKYRVHRDYHRTADWPEPFVHIDRAAVRAPWGVMAHNGWRAQNTLTEELFDDEMRLTEAGRRKVIWIATQAPEERRAVYILATIDQAATEARTESVRGLAAELTANGVQPPALMLTTRRPLRWSGDYYDRVEKAGRDAIAPPVLPEMVLTTDDG